MHFSGQVPYTPLARTPVMTVLSSVPRDHLITAIISQQRKVDLKDMGAWFHEL